MIAIKTQALKVSAPFFILTAVAFIATLIVGIFASISVAFPSIDHQILAFERVRPLHTLFPIVGVISGIYGWISFMSLKQVKKYTLLCIGLSFGLLVFFMSSASLSLLMGQFSGREYFSWPPLFTIPLVLSLILMIILLFNRTTYLSKISPEGFWLVGFGLFFITIGLAESILWLIPNIGSNIVKDITVQWHSIDTFFAGLNAFLYGVGVFILQKNPKPLRSKQLYFIAIVSLLFTFGHHHYASPQPDILKILAFIASMVAMFSFIKHLRIYKKNKPNTKASHFDVLFRSVALWTIVSFGSGILFAIPQVNLVVHGTYIIVIHAMGSMIGVQLVLVFAIGFSIFKIQNKYRIKRIKFAVKLLNISLVLMWILMAVIGLTKGFMRFNSSFYQFNDIIQNYLYLFPIVGLILFVAVGILSVELLSIILKSSKTVPYFLSPYKPIQNPISKIIFASPKLFIKRFKRNK